MLNAKNLYLILLPSVDSLRVHPLHPLARQTSWQASVPVPINVAYDIPSTAQWNDQPVLISPETASVSNFAESKLEGSSFSLPPDHLIAQSVTPEQFSIRLHGPSETLQQSIDGVSGLEGMWEVDNSESRRGYDAMKQALFDAISMNLKRIVRQSLSPLASLRNPLT